MKKGSLELGEKLTEADLEKFLPQLPSDLPESYLEFVKNHNGASGNLPIQPSYFRLWGLQTLVEYNEDYEIQTHLPNYFGIGDNGGAEFIAFNLENQKIFTIPFIPMDEKEAWLIAENFAEFEQIMGYTE